MNAVAQNLPPQNERRSQKWLWAAPLLVLGVFVLVLLPQWREPAYGGKKVSEWFNEAVGMTSEELYRSEAWRAFEQMEGDAVPFLVGCLRMRPSRLESLYADLLPKLPTAVSRFLPRPRIYLYGGRRIPALELLAHIARLQLMKAAEGAPSKKPSVALALPAMKTLLESGNEDDRVFTAQAATYMGPLAAPLVPQLLALVRSPTNSSPSALEALIGIGPAASNALPLICRLATNTDLKCRVVAVRGLEALGPTATAAMPLLTSLLLQETGPGWRSGPPEPDPVRAAMTQAGFSPRFMIARAMARVGAVPDEAVPVLLAMKQGTNWWERWAAALALWRREPGDPELKAQIIQSLHASNGFAVQLSLGGLGTNAAAFVPEIRRLADAPGPDGSAARRTLHAISHPAR